MGTKRTCPQEISQCFTHVKEHLVKKQAYIQYNPCAQYSLTIAVYSLNVYHSRNERLK